MEFTRDKLGIKLTRLVDEYEAMLVFLGRMNVDVRQELDVQRAGLESLTKLQLRNAIENLTVQINKLRKRFGATRPIGAYARILSKVPYTEDGSVMMFPAHLAVALFQRYPELTEALDRKQMPWHTRIELDARGQFKRQDRWQLRILEAVLYEDMCFFWNESSKWQRQSGDPYENKHAFKKEMALYRAAISSAFYMVEAFCNGIAFELLITRRSELSDRELQLVTEWDATKNRPRYLNIRDKLLQYPRLILRATSPPLQENNCAELSFFLSSAKKFRDSIVHASPGTDRDTFAATKWQSFELIGRDECARVIDSAISLVDQIATSIGRRSTVFWLQPRQRDGTFNESIFD